MLNNSTAFSSFSVKNIDQARSFYHDILGLELKENPMGFIELLLKDQQRVMIYPKPNHEPASFTVLNFMVTQLEEAVDQFNAKGITFEQYEGELKTNEKGISRGEEGGPAVAWFKDPDGNIIALIEGMP